MKECKTQYAKIPLAQIPKHVVIAWFRKAMQAGTLGDAARTTPPPRAAVANAVIEAVRASMKGQDEALIERAILEARRDADCLYRLVVNMNTEVIENDSHRNREYLFLLGYISAESNWKTTKDRARTLRSALLMFLRSVVILDAAIAEVASHYLDGRTVLFRECSVQVLDHLQMAKTLTNLFNELAAEVDLPLISLQDLRASIQSNIERQVSSWINLAIAEMLDRLGNQSEVRSAMDRCFFNSSAHA